MYIGVDMLVLVVIVVAIFAFLLGRCFSWIDGHYRGYQAGYEEGLRVGMGLPADPKRVGTEYEPPKKPKKQTPTERMVEETERIKNWNPSQPDPRNYPRPTRQEWESIDPDIREANTRALESMLNKLEGR